MGELINARTVPHTRTIGLFWDDFDILRSCDMIVYADLANNYGTNRVRGSRDVHVPVGQCRRGKGVAKSEMLACGVVWRGKRQKATNDLHTTVCHLLEVWPE